MSADREPKTLGELLVALEKSDNLRSLARECGMAPGDLRRSLRRWRREMGQEEERPKKTSSGSPDTQLPEELEGLTAASQLDEIGPELTEDLVAWTDGASRGNPGPAAIGVLFGASDGTPLAAHAETIGHATNNVAEYQAALKALEYAVAWRVAKLTLHLDSELVVKQLSGQYRVKSPLLMPFYRQIVSRADKLETFQVKLIRREKNTLADALANLALDGLGEAFGGGD